MKKEKFSKILTVILIMGMMVININVTAKANDTDDKDNVFEGNVEYNLGKDASIASHNLQTAKVNVHSMDIFTDENISLDGTVLYGTKEYNIDIRGKWYQSLSEDQNLIGDAVDETNNFQVITFSIIQNERLSNLRADKSLANNDILKIYLMENDTRNLITFEIALDDISSFNIEDMYSNVSILDDVTKEHWWINVFEPIIEDNSVSTYATHTDYHSRTIKYSDGPGGNTYRYEIDLRAWANIRDYSTSPDGKDTYGMEVRANRYYYNGVQYPGNFLKVNGCVATATLVGGNNSDVYNEVNFGYVSTITKGGLKANVSLGIGVGPVGGSLSWKPKERITTINPPKAINYESNIRGIRIPYDAVLDEVNDSYSLITYKERKTSSQTSKGAGAVFTFDIGFTKSDKLTSSSLVVAKNYN